MTDSDIKRLNRLFAQDLGRTPNGDPRYKWMRTRDLFYFIEDAVDTRTPAGLYVKQEGYQRVTWEQRIGPGWVVAAWQSPGTESQWKAQYKNVLPYPTNGMYFPIPASLLPTEVEPSLELTLEAIKKISQPLEEGFTKILARLKDEADRDDQKAKQASDDRIDSDWPAFNGEVHSKPYPAHVKETIQ